MKLPKVSMLVSLSAFSSGVPVKPMNIAPGSSCFIASCILPDCVRWASSTKTKRLPLAAKSVGKLGVQLGDEVGLGLVATLVVLRAAELVDQRADQPLARLWFSVASRSAPLLVR